MRKLAAYGTLAALVVIVGLPAPAQSAGVTFRGTVERSTVKSPKAAAIRILPAAGRARDAGVAARIEANPKVLAALERHGHAVDDVVAMTIGSKGMITLYVAD